MKRTFHLLKCKSDISHGTNNCEQLRALQKIEIFIKIIVKL